MSNLGLVPLALAVAAAGVGLLLLVWGVSRWLASRQPRVSAAAPLPAPVEVDLAPVDDAVLVARAGGRVLFANDLARQWFGLDGGDPDLMIMARQTHPADAFLELFAVEGRAIVEVRAPGSALRRVEATSHQVPLTDGSRFVVVMHETALPATLADERAAAAVSAIAEIGRAIGASLDLDDTLKAILHNVARAIPCDAAEIALWEPDSSSLRVAHRHGNRDYVVALAEAGDQFPADVGYGGWLVRHRRPLLIPDISQRRDVRPRLNAEGLALGAFLGVPLQLGDDLIGTLELSAVAPNAFDQVHLRLLETLAGQAAGALQNARRFEGQRRRLNELSGLAEVAQAVGSLTDPYELYSRLTERIAHLMRAQICGILLFDEEAAALVGQPPFYGLPDALAALYRIPVPAGTRVHQIWREAEYWLTNDAINDPVVSEVGLNDLATAIGARQTLLVPLPLGGRRLGVVQVSNKLEGESIEEADARQLIALAGQAAALIDNARLVRETRVRAERAEGLRRLAAVAGSAQPTEDILRLAVEESARLLAADLAVVLLLDEASGELLPHAASALNAPPDFLGRPPLTMADSLFRASAAYTRRPFLTNGAQTNERLHPSYRLLSQNLGLNCCLNVPLVVGERAIGEILIGARRESAYATTDLEFLQIIAAQIASAIERARLGETTDESLRRRVRQLTALARVSRQLNQTLQLDRILTSVHGEVLGGATEADYARIVLLAATSPGVAAGPEAGEPAPRVALLVGEAPRLGAAPPLQAVAEPGELLPLEAAYLAEAATAPATRREDPVAEADRLADDVRSGLIVPIVREGSVVGLIHLQSRKSPAFDPAAADFVQALADQTAVAVGNANRYEEQLARNELLRRRADQLSQLFQISRSVRPDQPMAGNMETIAFGVQESTGFDVVIISLLDPTTHLLEPTAVAGLPLAAFERIKKIRRPWSEIEPLLRDEHRISQSYFIPRRKRTDTGPLSSVVRSARSPAGPADRPLPPDGWQPSDLLLIPFRGSAGEILGMMHLDEPRNRRAPDRLTAETLEIFANQAALAIESARLYQTAEERAAELAQRLTDLSTSYAELDQVSRSLVQKDQELTRLVDELDLRNRRLLSVQHVIEVLGSAPDPASLARLVAEAVSGEMQMEACIIALREMASDGSPAGDSRLTVAAAAGFGIPAGTDLSPLLPPDPGANPIAHSIERNAPLLVRDVARSEWAGAALVIGLALRAFVCVPILLRGRISGALFVASQKAMISFSEQDIDLFTILASQLGISLENVGLYAETRDRLAEQTVLYDTSQELARAADARAVVAAVAERMVRHLDATALCYYSHDEEGGLIRADYEFWTPQAAPRERQSVLGQTWPIAEYPHLTATLAVAHGPDGKEGLRPAPRVLRWGGPDLTPAEQDMLDQYGGRTVVAVPMVVQDRVLGYFEIWDSRAQRRYAEADLRLIQSLGNQAAVAYESTRLYEQARQFNVQLERTVADRTQALQFERDRVETLLRITSELAASLDLDRVLQRALTLVNDVLHASQGSIFLVDPQSDRLLYRAALGRPEPLPPGGQPSPFTRAEGLVGWVVRRRQAVVIGDLEADPRWVPGAAGRPHRSALAAPLVTNDDVLGAIMFLSPEREAFNQDQLSLVSAAAAQVASAINNAELYRLIRDQAERLGAMLRSQQVEASKSRAILESIADGVMVADAAGRIVLLNAAAQRMLNLAPEIVGQPAAAFVGLYGPAGAAWADALARWQADPNAYRVGDFLAERFELEDKRVISVHLAPVTAADDYLGSVSLFRDITREVEVDRLKTEFVTTVSHELRTPLTPIKGYVDALLLGMAGAVEDQQRHILEVIKANIDRLSVLVSDLLDISRIESGKVALELEPVSVQEVVDEVVTSLHQRMDKEGKRLEVAVCLPPGLPPMRADRTRITQVVSNLAFNAFNYTPEGGTITVSAQVQSGVMQVSVRDTGIGIAPQNLQRIFERFYRGEDPLVLATAGTGLGLSIVKSVIEMHAGRLWAESEGVGRGSTFTFLVPLAE